jgi:shikimate kinase
MNIVLVGFKGAGKTVIGKIVAEKKKMSFVDTDEVIVLEYEKERKQKKSCREIYREHGEAFFRNLETHAIKTIKPHDNQVIAVGGGSVDREENRMHLSSLGTIVYLKESPSVIYARIQREDTPLFRKDSQKEDFEKLYKQREPIYERIADVVIESKGRGVHEIAHDIIKVI